MDKSLENAQGAVVWHDLITTDIASSLDFYKELLGWTYSTKNLGAYGDYHMINGTDRPLGGFMKPLIPDVPSHWSSYVCVPDIDSCLTTIENFNGRVIVGPLDIPDLGRFAVTLDPEGAAINLFTPSDKDFCDVVGSPKIGEFCWNECIVSNVNSAKEYYSRIFGWNFKEVKIDRSSTYWVARHNHREVAGMMKKPEDAPSPPHWLTYVLVKDLSKVLSQVGNLGGEILVKEIPVPELGNCAIIQDKVRAVLGLFSHRE